MDLKDKNFLITGGSSGIGKAIAHSLIEKGAQVAITGRDRNKLAKVAEELGAYPIHANVSTQEGVDNTFSLFMDRFKSLDGLINNAGIGGAWSSIDDLDIDTMRLIYDVNVFGAAMMAQAASKIFIQQQYGNIVNIASTAALKGYKNGTAYASSKFALRGMTQCWQAELRPYNVRVILINPSEVPTAFGQESREERQEQENKLHSTDIAHAVVNALTMHNRGFIPELTVHATNPF